MADGITWDDLPTELAGPGTEIRRRDFDGLAVCLIRLQAGVRTDPAPGHNLEAVTDAEYLEITRSEEYDGLMGHCRRVMAG